MTRLFLISHDNMNKLLYTLDGVLPPKASNGDLAIICAYIVHRYGLSLDDTTGVYAESVRFLRHSIHGYLDLTPPSSDFEIN